MIPTIHQNVGAAQKFVDRLLSRMSSGNYVTEKETAVSVKIFSTILCVRSHRKKKKKILSLSTITASTVSEIMLVHPSSLFSNFQHYAMCLRSSVKTVVKVSKLITRIFFSNCVTVVNLTNYV